MLLTKIYKPGKCFFCFDSYKFKSPFRFLISTSASSLQCFLKLRFMFGLFSFFLRYVPTFHERFGDFLYRITFHCSSLPFYLKGSNVKIKSNSIWKFLQIELCKCYFPSIVKKKSMCLFRCVKRNLKVDKCA